MKRLILAAAVATLFAGAAQAKTTEFIVFKEGDFLGESHVVKGEVNQLRGDFAGKANSLIVRGGYWEVCNDDHFKGTCRVLAEGEYRRLGDDLRNQVVSIRFLGDDPKFASRVAPDYRMAQRDGREARREWRESRREWRMARGAIDLYGRPAFRGRSIRVEGAEPDLADRNFDGRASSVIVHEGTWQLCTGPEFSGRCSTLEPGEYSHLAMLDDRVSSVRQLR
jgi:hypothetical protein